MLRENIERIQTQPWFKPQMLLLTESLELWYWSRGRYRLSSATAQRETFEGENFRELVEKRIFRGENFHRLLACVAKGCHTPKFPKKKKTFAQIATKSRKFSPLKVCQYPRAPMAQLVSFSNCWIRHSTLTNQVNYSLGNACVVQLKDGELGSAAKCDLSPLTLWTIEPLTWLQTHRPHMHKPRPLHNCWSRGETLMECVCGGGEGGGGGEGERGKGRKGREGKVKRGKGERGRGGEGKERGGWNEK